MSEMIPSEEYLRSIDVHQVLPQQDPFVMVGCLTHFEIATSTTETEVKESNIFVDGGYLSSFGMLENIAQTCAARVGYYNKFILHKEVKAGVIGAIRNYEIYGRPRVGETLTTRVDVVEEVFGLTLAQGEICCEGKILATAVVKLAVKND